MTGLHQIKASAGSGKTFELTRCFLKLLTRCSEPTKPLSSSACAIAMDGTGGQGQKDMTCGWGDILAVTFTNAAASEMRERVISTLKNIALGKTPSLDGLDQAKAIIWVDAIMRDLGTLNIRTIDSLLHLIVRSAALELHLHPDFQPVFTSTEALAPYVELFMERAWRGDTALRDLLRRCCDALVFLEGNKGFLIGDKLTDKLTDLLDETFLGYFDDLASPEDVNAKYARMISDVARSTNDLLSVGDAANLIWLKPARTALERLAHLEDIKKTSEYWKKREAAAFFRKGSEITASVEQAFTQYRAACDRFLQIGPLLRRHLQLAPFIEIAQLLVKEFRSNWSQEGALPGILIPQLALYALDGEFGVPDTLCRLGSRLTHYLLDEFQDTSAEQWQTLRPLVIEALSRGGSLTWVGDVKQSIYGWRQAMPALFDDICQDEELVAPASGLRCDNLPYNWRSHKVIIEHNNLLFESLKDERLANTVLSALLPDKMPDTIRKQACHRLSNAFENTRQGCLPHTPADGFVHACCLEGNTVEELEIMVQDKLVELLQNDIGTRRPWSDVLVLTRSNKVARQLAESLVAGDIPVITENSLLLAEHPLVIQSVAFLRFLNDQHDDVSFWAVLTGSLVSDHPLASGLDWDELHDWCSQPRKKQKRLWEEFRCHWPQIWRSLLAPFIDSPSMITPYDTMLEWYMLLDAEARFPEARTFLRRFMEVLYTAEEKGLATLSLFLDHWQAKSQEEKVPMPENMNAVRIMTIHKSKGLEAPVVIVPGTSFGPKSPQGHRRVECEGLYLVSSWCEELGEPYYHKLAQDACENLDLLYVAFTRAREELYIFQTKAKSIKVSNCSTILEILWQQAGLTLPYSLGKPLKKVIPLQESVSDPIQHQTKDLSGSPSWRPLHWLPKLKIYRNPLESFSFRPEDKGKLLHFCLENLRCSGEPRDDAATALAFGLANYPLRVPADPELHSFLKNALIWFAEQPLTAHWLASGLSEQPLVNDEEQLFRVDLLVPDQEGPLVIDYKSGQPVDEDVEQIRRYLACLESGQSHGKKARGILIYLGLQRFRLVTDDTVSPLSPDCLSLLPVSNKDLYGETDDTVSANDEGEDI